MKLIDLVDSIEYTTTNCFTHQLHAALHAVDPTIQTVALNDIENHPRPDRVICRLKQRTLCRYIDRLRRWLGDTPIVIFDQDPWEAFRVGSPYRGAYLTIARYLNVQTFAVTTKWWADYVAHLGLPSMFVRMWVLPEYCSSTPPHIDRLVPVGFVGSLHSYRRELFKRLEQLGTNVIVQAGGLGYADYLKALSRLQVFVHSEDSSVELPNRQANLSAGLWIKDIEAAARGCFSIRNRGSDSETYLDGVGTVLLYDDPTEVPGLLNRIQKMDPGERQSLIDGTVEYIKKANRWLETASALVMNSDTREGRLVTT